MSTEQQQTDSSGTDKKSFNIRVPQAVVIRIEEQAHSLGTTPTTLIQSIIVRHFESGGGAAGGESPPQTELLTKLDAIRKLCELIEQSETKRYAQMLFEIVKTRSALFHSLDQTFGAEGVDSIMDDCEEAARQYIARLSTGPSGETEQGR
jgi:hypothetical protein